MSDRREPVPHFSLLPLFFLSGAAGLAAQMVWVRMFAAGLGHETPSVLAVTAAFLGGLALGAWRLESWILRQANPARAYAKLELIIGVFAGVSMLLIPQVNALALKLTGVTPSPFWQWLVVFVLPLLALLPGTMAMGATLPAMERWLSSTRSEGRCVGALYAMNTLGAVAGTLGGVFVLMPALGFRGSLAVAALANLLCAGSAWWLSSRSVGLRPGANKKLERAGSETGAPSRASRSPNCEAKERGRQFYMALFLTGLLGIAFQLCVVRVLSQVFENTVYSYAAALVVYLAGTAIGAGLYQRFGVAAGFRPALNHLLFALAAAAALSVAVLPFAGTVYQTARGWFGDSLMAAVSAELVVSSLGLAIPAAMMGATFSHFVQGARESAGGIGRAAAINTLGCALAAPVVVMALPVLGVKWLLVAIAAGYLLLLPSWSLPGWRWVPLLAVLAFGLRADLRLVDRPENSEIIAYREGAMASVAVVKTSDGHRSLRVNNRLQMGGTGAALAERRQAHLPLLLHPAPKRALFLGPGTGITLGAASLYPDLLVDGVELVPEVVESMRHFEPENEGPFPNARVKVTAADARRFVRTTTNRYDVIVADLFHPAQDGAGFLYTYEHFSAVRARLNAGGLFCQWLPLHQLDEASLRSIAGTFLDTFSETRAFLLHFNVDIPALALVGTLEPAEVDARVFERRLETSDLRARLRGVGLERFINLAGCFAADTQALLEWAGNARPGTDDFPTVLFAAPHFAVRRDAAPHDLLLTLLGRWRTGEADLAAAGFGAAGSPFVAELRDYLAARDLYLRGLVEEAAGNLDAATETYLESARRSLQFTPGYARCVTVIQLIAKTDLPRARALFDRLEAAQPKQPLGRKLLGPLFGLPAPP